MLIYRETAEGGGGAERGSAAVQKYGGMKYRDAVTQRWGRGGEPLFPSFLPVFSSYLLDAERLFCPSIWALQGASAGFSGSFEGF